MPQAWMKWPLKTTLTDSHILHKRIDPEAGELQNRRSEFMKLLVAVRPVKPESKSSLVFVQFFLFLSFLFFLFFFLF